MADAEIAIFDVSGALNPVPVACDVFALLEIPRAAVVDGEALRRAFLTLSRRVHPDRFQAAGGEQLARSEAWTGLLNKAHATLRNQRARVLWLLADAGLVKPDESAAAGTSGVPKALLSEVFELREMLEEYTGSKEAALLGQITAARRDFGERMRLTAEAYGEAARQWDAGGDGCAKAADIARQALAEEKFYERLLGEIDAVVG